MNSFETMGSMQLLAFEGQRHVARVIALAVMRLLRRIW